MPANTQGNLYFVYRTHYEGPLSKRVRRLPDRDILHWFQRGWKVAAEGADCYDWVAEELGGRVYGLDSIFRASQEKRLPFPENWQQLHDLLLKHLYVEGGDECIQMDGRSLRVKTDDDEVELAYFFFEASLSQERPDRLAYLIQEDWDLPDGAGPGGFQPAMPVEALGPAGNGDGATYCALLTFYDSESFFLTPYVFPGVRMPDLAAYMRAVTPEGTERDENDPWQETWPGEMLVLRALLEPDENDLRGALERCNLWPAFDIERPALQKRIMEPLDYPTAHAAALELREQYAGRTDRDPAATLIQQRQHLAQMSIHMNKFFGYQQWFLFDDTWASAHPDLAQSLLWYTHTWDILQDDVSE